jgi:pimeloyl-ACP methyl ester carboxylesterase
MPYAHNSDVSIYYESYGEGHPLVLVHANPFDHRLWTYQIPRYSTKFRTIAMDLRGYGRSSKPERRFNLRDMADDVLAVCKAEEIEHAIFAGVSVGSGIAMLLGLEQPAMVDALILVGGSSRGADDPTNQIEGYSAPDFARYFERHIKGLVAPGFADTPLGKWLLNLFIEDAPSLSGRCIAEIFRARSTCDMELRLPQLARPTLVINGEHDVSLAGGRLTASRIPGAMHAMIPGTGHACNIEDPRAFDDAVFPFLAKLGFV